MQILSGNRFRLGLGAGENLNEHVVGTRWPAVGVRHEMLSEAIDIISDAVRRRGQRQLARQVLRRRAGQAVGSAGASASRSASPSPGRRRAAWPASKADLMIAVEPEPELGEMFDAAGGAGKPRVGQIALAYDPDRDAAVQRAHEQFRWFGLGWKVNADLPNPESFEAATQFVTPEQVAASLCLRPGRRGARREDQAVHRGRLHRGGAGPDRRRPSGGVHRLGRAGAAARAALALSPPSGPDSSGRSANMCSCLLGPPFSTPTSTRSTRRWRSGMTPACVSAR